MTTTSATSTPTPSATQQVLTSLNAGSGVDSAALVTALVAAQFADKNDALAKRSDALTAQISGVSSLLSNISQFASALSGLVKGGSLASQPVSANPSVVQVSALNGAKLTGLSASLEVRSLAAAQVSVTQTSVDAAAKIGTGTLTLQIGGAATKSITIDDTNNTISGIAAAINAAGAGVTASVVTDADGKVRLALKGHTGAAQGFTIATDSGDGLNALTIGQGDAAGMTTVTAAANAKLRLDGIDVERGSNTVSDLVPGVKLDLTSAAPGAAVSLTSSTPSGAISQAVSNFVETYNQVLATVKKETDPVTGELKADSAAQSLLRSLRQITLAPLTAGAAGQPKTLAEIGVGTNRDGTLSLDTATLTKALVASPEAVQAMFGDGSTGGGGLTGAVQSIADAAANKSYGLTASTATYTSKKADVADAQTKAADDADTLKTRLTKQFSAMDARVAAYKSTQTFLQAQIDAWNKKD